MAAEELQDLITTCRLFNLRGLFGDSTKPSTESQEASTKADDWNEEVPKTAVKTEPLPAPTMVWQKRWRKTEDSIFDVRVFQYDETAGKESPAEMEPHNTMEQACLSYDDIANGHFWRCH